MKNQRPPRRLVLVAERARVRGCNRGGVLFEWDLFGGSNFRRARFMPCDVFEASHGGPLVVYEVAAAAQGIFSGKPVGIAYGNRIEWSR